MGRLPSVLTSCWKHPSGLCAASIHPRCTGKVNTEGGSHLERSMEARRSRLLRLFQPSIGMYASRMENTRACPRRRGRGRGRLRLRLRRLDPRPRSLADKSSEKQGRFRQMMTGVCKTDTDGRYYLTGSRRFSRRIATRRRGSKGIEVHTAESPGTGKGT